ncbi:plsX [Acrasis kona]|uniref:PlsX n=1 Tax=Acrasis kona TaxID=1008807 RepID=A0AAW2ZMB4_9EUKA
MSIPCASTRVSIAFLPNPHSEPTNTLVLRGKEWYTDFRPVLNTSVESDGFIEAKNVEFIFAGKKRCLDADLHKYEWVNIIDSRDQQDVAADIGECKILPNGDEFEKGTMKINGIPTQYEEIWRDLQFEKDVPVPIIAVELSDDSASQNGLSIIVVRVGEQCQGVLLKKQPEGLKTLAAKRSSLHNNSWKTDIIYGSSEHVDMIPNCPIDFNSKEWRVGDLVQLEGSTYNWLVREFFSYLKE